MLSGFIVISIIDTMQIQYIQFFCLDDDIPARQQ